MGAADTALMMEILFLLLPLAFFSGWRSGRRPASRTRQQDDAAASQRFVRGINFLLNEEPDKALDVFIEAPVIDAQTAETLLALGNLFRNRGEVNRALRVHQNLVARPGLSQQQRQQAMLALGDDFFAAGMLDRAESVFSEILRNYPGNRQAREPLRQIYEQLQEWDKAIELVSSSGGERHTHQRLIAHYLCEQAEVLLVQNHLFRTDEKLRAALAIDPDSARVRLLQAQLALAREQRSQALQLLMDAVRREQRLLGSLQDKLLPVFDQPDEQSQLLDFVSHEYADSRDAQLFPALLQLARASGCEDEILPLIYQHLRTDPVTLQTLGHAGQFLLQQDPLDTRKALQELCAALERLNRTQPRYQCAGCGYKLSDYLWRCPACHRWDSIQLA
ncbi:MAG TPA: tetratricopeptide repeat protein [Thiolinea sp.]|nr:tetratricopeptide repeat protein [Thiolinea sp.]